ncbi:S9 family peptidase [Porticoccaceae bacterium]|nr:S9 family peptidase [Porticoccaceae bacterium]
MTDNQTLSTVRQTEEIQSRYERAKSLSRGMFDPSVPNTLLFPVWIKESNTFWYERQLSDGKEFRLVNAETASNELAFNHEALAQALAEANAEQVAANNLPINHLNGQIISTIEMTLNPLTVNFTAFGKRWAFIDELGSLKEIEQFPNNALVSPDGKQVVFSRDYNLWIQDLVTREERALTADGQENYQYAIPGSVFGNDAFIPILGLQALWSQDSKRLFTVQLDQRQVETVGVVSHVPTDGSLRPQTTFRKLAFPEDKHIEEYCVLSIDVGTGHTQEAGYERVPVSYGGCGGFFENSFGWWSIDNTLAYFVDVDRYYKYVRVVEFNTDTGATKILFEETSATRVDLTMGACDQAHFLPLPETHELLWYSDRSGWAHYYLYDLQTGQLKNTVTFGEWLVRDFIHFDDKRRELFVTTSGRFKDHERDPYYRDLIRVNIDTGNITTLISGDYEHITASPKDIQQSLNGYVGTSCGVSPLGDYAVVTRSRADQMPSSYLLDRHGEKILDLEIPDKSKLPKNWQWPEPVKMTAADGKTDIYGVMYRPSDFSPKQSYPIIDQSFVAYPSPIAAKGSFANSISFGMAYYEALALAELGFIVVQIDGRGSRYRGKAFRDESYGWMNSISHIDDHVAGIQQLAERFSYMDLERVGICGLHMGGNGALEGLLKHPNFYKVGVAAQLYDARIMASNSGDLDEGAEPSPNQQHPEALIHHLKGKLLLMVGLQDYVPPAVTFRLVEALQRSNKDFDLVVEPNWGYSASTYQIRRAWDYLVQHLKGEQPPKEFEL